MGTIEFGYPQKLSFDYNSAATAKIFNGVSYGLTPKGIYSGFTLSKLSNTTVIVSAGSCYIQDTVNSVGTRVETGANTEAITVSSSTPFIILRFDWIDSQNNYMDVLAVASADIRDEDLVVGRCVFDEAGVVMDSVFDLTRRSINILAKINYESTALRVTPTEPRSNQVIVSAGILNSSKGNLLISGGTYPTAGLADTRNGRNDLIYIDENGIVQVILGNDSPTPITPRYGNRKVIAEIRRGATRTNIKGSEIFKVISSFDSASITSDQLIIDTGGLYSSTNVEDALQEIAGSTFEFKGDKTFSDSVTVNAGLLKVAQKLKGASGVNIQEIRTNSDALVQYVDQNGKLVNTVRNELAILDEHSVFTTDKVEHALNQIAGGTMTIKGAKTFDTVITVPSLTSTVATGTAPFVVASKTPVVNLQVQSVELRNGSDPSSPFVGQMWFRTDL